MNIIITALDEAYWNPWGMSWLGSLLDVAEAKSKIIIVNYGLLPNTASKIKDFGVEVIDQKPSNNIRQSCLDFVADVSQKSNDKYVYYDSDVWFQGGFENIFDMIENRLLIAKNHNCGFIAGQKEGWSKYNLIKTLASKVHDENHFESLIDHFGFYANEIDNSYNCIQIPDLVEKNYLLCLNDVPQKVIHPTGSLKKLSVRKNVFFQERYPEVFNKFVENKKISLHRMLSKNIHPPIQIKDQDQE